MNLLSIGGSDPSSGAGIQSDVKTFSILGAYGLTVITAITSQNTSIFDKVEPVSEKMVKNQLESVISDFKIDGIKISMVYNSKIIKAIFGILKKHKIPMVFDPVIESTTGGELLEKSALNDLKKIISLVSVITPNKSEAEILSKIKIKSKNDLQKAAKKIQTFGIKNVIITGFESNKKIFDYIRKGKTEYMISGPKIGNTNHGSGCNYSASLTYALATGMSLHDAVKFSKKFTFNSIKNSKKIGRGIKITSEKKVSDIFSELSKSINDFISIKNIYKQIPECQTNFVYSKKSPKTINDILGISGRIVKTGENVTVAGDLKYGGSKHVANALLMLNQKFPSVRSAINLRYNKKTITKFEKSKLKILSYDRTSEPKKIKQKEGSSVSWGIKTSIKNAKTAPDVIYHVGDLGKEPMIIVFGKNPSTVLEKITVIQK